MKKAFFFFAATFLVYSCASFASKRMELPAAGMPSMEEQWESGHLIAGAVYIIGVASRHAWREHEIAAAKNDAAQKIAMFYGMRITSSFYQRMGTGISDFTLSSRTGLEHIVDYTQFIEQLTFDPEYDILVHDLGTLVRFRYEAPMLLMVFSGGIGTDGRPEWISGRGLPEIDGYMAAVGFSMRQEWLRNTVMISAADAAARLMRATSANTETIVEDDIDGRDTVAYIRITSKGILYGFRVLEFWIDPNNGAVFTLGIARIAE